MPRYLKDGKSVPKDEYDKHVEAEAKKRQVDVDKKAKDAPTPRGSAKGSE